jgi:hypothetical protein
LSGSAFEFITFFGLFHAFSDYIGFSGTGMLLAFSSVSPPLVEVAAGQPAQ